MATIENFATVRYTSGGVTETKVSNLAEIGLESAVTLTKNTLVTPIPRTRCSRISSRYQTHPQPP